MIDRLKMLLAYLEEDPADPFTRFALAQEYRKRGEVETAASYYQALVENAPEYVGTYYHLGKLYEEMNRTPDALAVYETGIRIAREQRDFHALAELQDAHMQAKGVGWDDE